MSKELEVKNKSDVAPSYLAQFAGAGAEDVDSSIVEKSFLQMAHEDKDGIKRGEWYDSNTLESFGTDVSITICRIHHTHRKFNNDFQLEAISSDGNKWDNGESLTEDEKWQCAFIDMFVLVKGSASTLPYIVSFKSTSYKTGKKIATTVAKFTKGNGEPIFARSYTLYTEEAKKGSKSYCVAKYKLDAGFNDEETMKHANNVRKMVMNVTPDATSAAGDIELDVDID